MLGVTFRAARTQTGRARSAATVVPMAAMATVSAARSSRTGSSSVAGGQALTAHDAILGRPAASLVRFTFARCQLTT